MASKNMFEVLKRDESDDETQEKKPTKHQQRADDKRNYPFTTGTKFLHFNIRNFLSLTENLLPGFTSKGVGTPNRILPG
jgi:hypothetical protein